jgi:nitric oxide reductase NorE protein
MPGEAGIWIFISGDLVIFSLFFLTYLYYRADQLPLFASSQSHLNQGFGLLNTFFMLSSSWFVASGVRAARRNQPKAPAICFMLALACAAGFAAVKLIEYREKIGAGITILTNDFFMYYFMLTGIHFFHVLIGMGVLIYLTQATLPGVYDAAKIKHVETGASFWHVVDLLWIVLFALLYLVR